MLDKIAKRFQTAVLVLLVAALSMVFVLEFGGPQSQGCSGGGGTYAARVRGDVITEGDFRAAYTLGSFNRYPLETQRSMKLKEVVLQGLIERKLLADEARRLGFSVDDDDVMEQLVEYGTVYLSLAVDAPAELPRGKLTLPVKDDDGKFDKEAAKNIIQYHLRRTVGEFAAAQVEEQLAQRMRETIAGAVSVSPVEVWDAFVREQDRASLEYVRFSPQFYRDALVPTAAALDAWIKENTEKVDAEYDRTKHRYTGLEKQVRARHILIKVDADADEATKSKAKKELEALEKRARSGADFATLAREHSQDPGSAKKGGDLGWNPRGRMVDSFDEAQFALEAGQISSIVESPFGFHLIKVEGIREGDVPEAEAKREIAERLYVESEADAKAKQAAEQALARLASGTTFEALDEELKSAAGEEEAPLAPRLRTTGAFGRGDQPISGPFDSSALVQAAFTMRVDDPLPKEPIKLGQEYVVFRLVDRQEATKEAFTNELRDRLTQSLLEAKREEAVTIYTRRLRKRAEDDEDVRVNPSVLSYGAADEPTG